MAETVKYVYHVNMYVYTETISVILLHICINTKVYTNLVQAEITLYVFNRIIIN